MMNLSLKAIPAFQSGIDLVEKFKNINQKVVDIFLTSKGYQVFVNSKWFY